MTTPESVAGTSAAAVAAAAAATPTLRAEAVRFAHAVNTPAALDAALRSGVNFVEADVVMGSGDGVAGRVVMGHDVGCASAFTFEDFVSGVAARGVGLKVDIKQWACVTGVVETLRRLGEATGSGSAGATATAAALAPPPWPLLRLYRGDDSAAAYFDKPALMINADVLTGTTNDRGGGVCRFNPRGEGVSRAEQVSCAAAAAAWGWAHARRAMLASPSRRAMIEAFASATSIALPFVCPPRR